MIEALIALSFIFICCYIAVSNLLSKRLLGGLQYVALIESDKKEFTSPSTQTNKKPGKHHNSQASEKDKKSLTFIPSVINRSHLPVLYPFRFVKVLYTFFAFFASTIVLLFISIILLFMKSGLYINLSQSFLKTSLLTTFIFLVIGLFSSFSYRHRSVRTGLEEYVVDQKFNFWRFLISLFYPTLSVFSQITIAKNIPFGPFDIHSLMENNNLTITFITFSISFLLSFSYSTTNKLNSIIHRTIKDPPRTLFSTKYYQKTLTNLLRELPSIIFESIYNFVPTDIFFLLGIRIYFNEKVNDVIIDNIFIILVTLSSVFKLLIIRSCVQLIFLRDTFQALDILDKRKTTKAWDNVTKTTENLLTYLPQMCVAFMLPACINFVMCIIYWLSYVIMSECSDSPNALEMVPWLRIMSVFVISSSEITAALQQLVPDGL